MSAPTLLFQNFSTAQSEQQPQPNSIVTAAVIAPSTFMTTLVGTTAIATITPPLPNQHMLAIMPLTTNFGGFLGTTNSGADGRNIARASLTNSTTWGTRPSLFFYDPRTELYYPMFGVSTTNS
jgi:hypothetical protein